VVHINESCRRAENIHKLLLLSAKIKGVEGNLQNSFFQHDRFLLKEGDVICLKHNKGDTVKVCYVSIYL